MQAATDMHPARGNKQNYLTLSQRIQFWVQKTFSKLASLKRASTKSEADRILESEKWTLKWRPFAFPIEIYQFFKV